MLACGALGETSEGPDRQACTRHASKPVKQPPDCADGRIRVDEGSAGGRMAGSGPLSVPPSTRASDGRPPSAFGRVRDPGAVDDRRLAGAGPPRHADADE